jgi:hypothetical protein
LVLGRICGRDPQTSEEEPFGEKARRRTPKELGAEAILVIH